MWAALGALNGVPTLVVRGERSDILSAGSPSGWSSGCLRPNW